MKILQIGTVDKSGGAAMISWKIKCGLERLGNKVWMFVSTKCSNDSNVFIIKKTVHRYWSMIFSNDIDLFNTNWIIKTKEFRQADIVHFHNLHGWFFNLKTLQKISILKPSIWTLHDMWAITPHCAHSFDGELKNGFYQCPRLNMYPRILWHNEKYLMWRKRKIYEKSKLEIVVPSLWLKDKVQKSALGDKNIHLIYNGIDVNIFRRHNKETVREKLNIPKDKKIVLFISDGGKNNQYKGWGFVEKILNIHKNDTGILFICIGGKEADNTSGKTASNILYIKKIIDQNLLAEYYSSADIFLYPSLADSFGLVAAESMGCGTPVLTFNTGGIPEIVEHKKNGYVANYGDIDDLEKGLQFLLKLSINEQTEMSKSSIDRITSNFTEEIMVNNYLNLYKKII